MDCSRQQQDGEEEEEEEHMNEGEDLVVGGCQENRNRKSSQTTMEEAAATKSIAIYNKQGDQDVENEQSKKSEINKESPSQVSNRETEEKSSCDEGLGTGSSGNSSAQSSSAGSHCDDRETPPHVVVREEPPTTSSPSNNNNNMNLDQIDQPIHCSNSCDNLKLSSDSLNKSIGKQQQQQSKNKVKHQRNHSFTLSDDEAEKVLSSGRSKSENKQDKSSSRRLRALTWSASLSSFGASFKFGSKSGPKAAAASDPSHTGGKSKQLQKSGEKSSSNDLTNNKTILFHTDCFSCSTCNELLVDLRALIYVSEQPPINNNDSQRQQDMVTNKHDSDYVNLNGHDRDDDSYHHGERLIGDMKQQCCNGSSTSKQQISLYCHRHFVELFKPRCQQCDCLILDEECTEAEGKFSERKRENYHPLIYFQCSSLLR